MLSQHPCCSVYAADRPELLLLLLPLPKTGVTTSQSPLLDRRVPYYVLSGCDYMWDAGERCDTAEFEPAVGCCPIGFRCMAQPNKVCY